MFRRGLVEKRGRPRRLTPQNVKALDRARKRVLAAAKGEREVHWGEVIKKARVPDARPSAAARSLRAAGIPMAARTPREMNSRSASSYGATFRPVDYASDDTIPVRMFLSIFIGKPTEIQVSQAFNDGNHDGQWNKGVVLTGREDGLWAPSKEVSAEDVQHMTNRVGHLRFNHVFARGESDSVCPMRGQVDLRLRGCTGRSPRPAPLACCPGRPRRRSVVVKAGGAEFHYGCRLRHVRAGRCRQRPRRALCPPRLPRPWRSARRRGDRRGLGGAAIVDWAEEASAAAGEYVVGCLRKPTSARRDRVPAAIDF